MRFLQLCAAASVAVQGTIVEWIYNSGSIGGDCPDVCPKPMSDPVTPGAFFMCYVEVATEYPECQFTGYTSYEGSKSLVCTSDGPETYFVFERTGMYTVGLMQDVQTSPDSVFQIEFSQAITEPCEMRIGIQTHRETEHCGLDLETILKSEVIGTLTPGSQTWDIPYEVAMVELSGITVGIVSDKPKSVCGGDAIALNLNKSRYDFTASVNPLEETQTGTDENGVVLKSSGLLGFWALSSLFA